MRLKRGGASNRNGAELPFRSFEVEISTLERAAKSGGDSAARIAMDSLIKHTRALEARIRSLRVLPDTHNRYDIARFALENAASSQDQAIRKLAFESMDWNPITLKAFMHCPHPDIRRMARERLNVATRRSDMLKEQDECRPTELQNYRLGTWRF